ncbi:MAG: DUF427 domain-containing protein [Oligoflexales bacterium]
MKSVQAVWQGVVIAASNKTVQVEGNYYFPKESVNFDHLKPSETVTHCPWKGDAAYHHVQLDSDNFLKNAVWSYPNPSREALQLKDHFAFWNGIEIVKESESEKNERLANKIGLFKEKLEKSAQEKIDSASYVELLRSFLGEFGEDGLIYSLPLEFTQNLSFFNFYNSNDACLQTDQNHKILRVNRTFTWVFNHLPNMIGKSFEEFIKHVEIIEGEDNEKFFHKITTHGWARIPKLKVKKEDSNQYYLLDVAITKHGDLDDLTGFQCQLTNITKEVELSTSLEESQTHMKSLLSGIKEGLFYFEKTGQISPERSLALKDILKGSEECSNLFEIINKCGNAKSEVVEVCLNLLWPAPEDSGFMSPFDDTVSMLPKELSLQEGNKTKYVKFLYNPLYGANNELEKVIVVVSDITEVIKSQKAADAQAERVQKISHAANSLQSYKSFLEEATTLISLTTEVLNHDSPDRRSMTELKRHLHTLKGMLGIFHFSRLASQIHAIEDQLNSAKKNALKSCLEMWNIWLNEWNTELEDIDSTLGIDKKKDFLQVTKQKVERLGQFASKQGHPDLIDLCNNLIQFETPVVFDKYKSYVDEICSRRLDKKAIVRFAEGNCELAYDEVKKVDAAIIHILRNSLDHGIEEIEDRETNGKPKEGVIEFVCSRSKESICLKIIDDGAGINGEKLAAKAVACGIWTQNQLGTASWEDKINLIFEPNLSSKDEVSELSGRGVGMDAVKDTMETMGGQISISSTPGKGSTFILTIPIQNLLVHKNTAA